MGDGKQHNFHLEPRPAQEGAIAITKSVISAVEYWAIYGRYKALGLDAIFGPLNISKPNAVRFVFLDAYAQPPY